MENEIRKRLICNFKKNHNENFKDKERTKTFLSKALNQNEVVFISDYQNKKIEKYLKEIGEEYFYKIDVYGNANKLFIDKNYLDLPESMIPKGFDEEVLLRRKQYHQILEFLKYEKGFYTSITTVIGDNYEVDLALPDYLNYNIIQIENGYSKKHERDYLGKRFVRNYEELEKLLF